MDVGINDDNNDDDMINATISNDITFGDHTISIIFLDDMNLAHVIWMMVMIMIHCQDY